jgi:hypothetical protein
VPHGRRQLPAQAAQDLDLLVGLVKELERLLDGRRYETDERRAAPARMNRSVGRDVPADFLLQLSSRVVRRNLGPCPAGTGQDQQKSDNASREA